MKLTFKYAERISIQYVGLGFIGWNWCWAHRWISAASQVVGLLHARITWAEIFPGFWCSFLATKAWEKSRKPRKCGENNIKSMLETLFGSILRVDVVRRMSETPQASQSVASWCYVWSCLIHFPHFEPSSIHHGTSRCKSVTANALAFLALPGFHHFTICRWGCEWLVNLDIS